MAKFQFIEWLIDWLEAHDEFEFVWDAGNSTKNIDKHEVENTDAEAIFYDPDRFPLGIQVEPLPDEPRFGILGAVNTKKMVHVSFTIRDGRIRIISARPMHKKERLAYDQNVRKK